MDRERPIEALKVAPISQNQEITREIAQNAKSCSKRKKLPSNLWKALATPAGKIGFFRVGPARKSYLFATNKSTLLTKLVRSRWLKSGLVICAFLLTSTSSAVNKNAKKNLANIQLS